MADVRFTRILSLTLLRLVKEALLSDIFSPEKIIAGVYVSMMHAMPPLRHFYWVGFPIFELFQFKAIYVRVNRYDVVT